MKRWMVLLLVVGLCATSALGQYKVHATAAQIDSAIQLANRHLATAAASGAFLIKADSTTLKNSVLSQVLKNADSTAIRNYSSALYLKNADSTTLKNALLKNADSTHIRNYSGTLYLKNADSTAIRNYSSTLYLKNADSTTIKNGVAATYLTKVNPLATGSLGIGAAISPQHLLAGIGTDSSTGFNFSMSNFNTTRTTPAQARDTSSVNAYFTNTGKPLFSMVGVSGNTIVGVDSLGRLGLGVMPTTFMYLQNKVTKNSTRATLKDSVGSSTLILDAGEAGVANPKIGTTSADQLDVITNNTVKLSVAGDGTVTIPGGVGISGALTMGSTSASSGFIRLPNNNNIQWRNSTNDANIGITMDNTNKFVFDARIQAPTHIYPLHAIAAGDSVFGNTFIRSTDSIMVVWNGTAWKTILDLR